MRIKILWIGRTRNASLEALCADYYSRVRRMIPCDVVEVPDLSRRRLPGKELRSAEGREIEKRLSAGARVVVLDAGGLEFDSPGFAQWIQKEQNRGSRELAFVIGGPEGLSDKLKGRAHLRLSLGKMTWTHEIARVLLLEQVYRALTILQNSPYHR